MAMKNRKFGDFRLSYGKYSKDYRDTTFEQVKRVALSAPRFTSWIITPL
ncbi:hypothetical protein [uncultured Photobacterium sp.]|nr:hypothetical protein [uncultured Photobacterium sp.]